MAYTRTDLYNKLQASYQAMDVQGELADLCSNILADYLYLHQLEDVSILLEDSFLRSKLLTSKIQHAADNFCSINRGSNRLITIDNLGCLAPTVAKKFDTIASYGQYKLVYAEDYAFMNTDQVVSIQAYLTVEPAQTLTIQGNGKYYIDLEDGDGNLIQNISENITVTSLDDGGTIDESDDVYHVFKISGKLTDLYEEDKSTDTENVGNGMKAEICAMTLPNYGVRLWKADKFQENYVYIIKFLKSPDLTKKELELPNAIRSIPGFSMNANGRTTTITVKSSQEPKEEDPDRIYLLAAVGQKFQSTMKSINSIDEIITVTCPLIKGFYTDIDGQTINVYYTSDGALPETYQESLQNALKSYNINQTVYLTEATPKDYKLDGTSSSSASQLNIDIHYTDLLDLTLCSEIVNAPRYVVGQTWNPYQMIADIMANPSLLGKVSLVEIYDPNNEGDKVTPAPVILQKNQCITYTPIINYISDRS